MHFRCISLGEDFSENNNHCVPHFNYIQNYLYFKEIFGNALSLSN